MKMRVYVVLLIVLILAGCAPSAALNNVNGKFYMMGDNACARYNALPNDLVQCFNSEGKVSEQRRALNQSEVQTVLMVQAQEQQQLASMGQSLQQAGESVARNSPSYSYTAPQVMPITRLGGNQIRCISTDIYMNCRSY
jgi:hypothetical protein